MPVNDRPVEFKIDTGMSQCTFNSLPQKPRLVRTRPSATSPGGEVKCIGKFLAVSQYEKQKILTLGNSHPWTVQTELIGEKCC